MVSKTDNRNISFFHRAKHKGPKNYWVQVPFFIALGISAKSQMPSRLLVDRVAILTSIAIFLLIFVEQSLKLFFFGAGQLLIGKQFFGASLVVFAEPVCRAKRVMVFASRRCDSRITGCSVRDIVRLSKNLLTKTACSNNPRYFWLFNENGAFLSLGESEIYRRGKL